MFNLDNAIAEWRRQMSVGGIENPEALDELESHLRDDVEHRARAGETEETAFQSAIRNIGRTDVLKGEFAKIAMHGRFKQALLILAGVPNPQLATTMNTTHPNLEPRWATYVKGGAFLTPAFLLWIFSMVFIFPKLQQLSRDAGAAIPGFLHLLFFIQQHAVLACSAIALTLAALEWRSRTWPRYRRATVGVTVFVLNATVLVAITMMVILAILVAPALAQQVK